MNQKISNQAAFKSLQEAHGKIPYNMTNDYMFRAVLHKNNKVLRGLIGSLLHLTEDEMLSVTITNPIIIGEALNDKEFRLDINVNLNVIIQYLHNYDAKIHLKSLSAMGFLLIISFSYGLSSKCFDLPE